MTEPSAKRTGRPLEAQRHGGTGGENAIPRSLGLTLETLREGLGIDEAEMLERLLERKDSPYKIRKYSTKRRSMEHAVRAWETAQHEPQFGMLHRYGLIFDSWSGILHLISLFCADLRDAADPAERTEKLDNIEVVADRMIAVAQRARALAKSYRDSDAQRLGRDMTDPAVRRAQKDLIRDLLAAYHSVPRRS